MQEDDENVEVWYLMAVSFSGLQPPDYESARWVWLMTLLETQTLKTCQIGPRFTVYHGDDGMLVGMNAVICIHLYGLSQAYERYPLG